MHVLHLPYVRVWRTLAVSDCADRLCHTGSTARMQGLAIVSADRDIMTRPL